MAIQRRFVRCPGDWGSLARSIAALLLGFLTLANIGADASELTAVDFRLENEAGQRIPRWQQGEPFWVVAEVSQPLEDDYPVTLAMRGLAFDSGGVIPAGERRVRLGPFMVRDDGGGIPKAVLVADDACDQCHGQGDRCKHCEGRGTCGECQGKAGGCDACDHSGRCKACDGRGCSCPPSDKPQCPKCGGKKGGCEACGFGSGVCAGCKGTGTRCKECDGQGKCSSCQGKGGDCPACRGSGKCGSCNGQGGSCPVCGGACPVCGDPKETASNQGKPGDGKPGDGKPGDGKPGDGKPGAGKPGDGKPGDGKPGDGKPGDGKPGDGKPGAGKPGDGKPGAGKPGAGKPNTNSGGGPGKPKPGDFMIYLVNDQRLHEPGDVITDQVREAIKDRKPYDQGAIVINADGKETLLNEGSGPPEPDKAFRPFAASQEDLEGQVQRVVEAIARARRDSANPGLRTLVVWPERELVSATNLQVFKSLASDGRGPVSFLCPDADPERARALGEAMTDDSGKGKVTVRSPKSDELVEHIDDVLDAIGASPDARLNLREKSK